MRLGLLLANSTLVGRLAGDIRLAVDFGLRDGGLSDVDLIVETTAYNAVGSEVVTATQNLAIKQNVDAVIAPLNPALFGDVATIAIGQEIPVLALTMGEDVFAGDSAPPWVFSLSFDLWRSHWLMAHSAVKSESQVCMICAAHDGAYGISSAVERGIQAAGATLAATLPLPLMLSEPVLLPMQSALEDIKPDCVIVLASGDDLALIRDAIIKRFPDLPIVEPPPTSFGAVTCADRTSTIPMVSGLDPSLPGASSFLARFGDETGRPVPAYAILAYEAGLALADAAQACDGRTNGRKLRDALAACSMESPRGKISFDPSTLDASGQLHLLNGALQDDQWRVTSSTPMDLPQQLIDDHANGEKTGWLNPFLIA